MDWYIQFVRQLDKVVIDNSAILQAFSYLSSGGVIRYGFDFGPALEAAKVLQMSQQDLACHISLTFLIRIQFVSLRHNLIVGVFRTITVLFTCKYLGISSDLASHHLHISLSFLLLS